ncbi:hypothetical protein ERW51_16500 [Aliivibrio finisterrensis]|uniref:hypothetical protein n=1 Tax=Aliivibrio finisterrensis TaxID=511998 RepID=UPI001021A33F|nr:hypothetical protein [Aliivibrio finisterrensis]RYU56047.1 hypothetical protein ERW56_01360 [Aliivibrio finisterrensis]RYU61140.1 hypothetical protein ERW50_02275 [Aliivibrio finisterrensis]RYU68303.1 hypothetical protein ERW51_16500 [Aliivibrio finisterrensis]RYU68994.1 hypothetical protein ERW54_06405 [Aliivibrio finisterrensis]RYU71778.1 hypothetical protein ERW48_16935 [Aliivibrio finisterrensis]
MSHRKVSKPVFIDDDFYAQPVAIVEPIHICNLKLKCNGVTSHIDQLMYQFVPDYSSQGNGKKSGVDYIFIPEREKFVRNIYRHLKKDFNETKAGHFRQLKGYIRWMDNIGKGPINNDYFHPELYNAFMHYHQGKCNRGEQKLATWVSAKKMLSFFLKVHNRVNEAKELPSIKGIRKDTDSHKGIDVDGEFKPLVRRYIYAFSQFRKYHIEGVKPLIHPLWHEDWFNQTAEREQWYGRSKVSHKNSFKTAVTNGVGALNHFSCLSAMLAFCFTGQNTTPLLSLRFSDIRFTNKSNGRVYFDMTKARAKYLDFDTSLGFHKKTQEFFHQWLVISIELQKDSGTDWLFPYFTEANEIKGCVETGNTAPQVRINRLTKKLGLAHVTPSILRQTKIDALMKVTQDIWLVAMSANNSVETISVSYSDGNESDHRNSIAASIEALYDASKNSTNIYEAANKAKFNHTDVLNDYDYKKLRTQERVNDKQTPLGTRCKDASQGVASTIKKNMEKLGVEQSDELICTDFLSCFECEHHRLVSEVEDIWLMLSFNDTLQEMKDYPAINSLPTEKFHKLCNTIESILKRFKEVSFKNYTEAKEKHNEAPHPLYSDGYSLLDLMEAF